MDRLGGGVSHNLQVIREVAAKNQDSDIHITSSSGANGKGQTTDVTAVKAERGWFGWVLSLFGFEVSREDTSGSSKQFITAFKHNYGSTADVVLDHYGVKEGQALLGRNVALAMKEADEILKEKSKPLDKHKLLDEPFFKDVVKEMGVSLEQVRNAYVQVLEAKQAEIVNNSYSVYSLGKPKQREMLIEALRNIKDGDCSYGEALLHRLEQLDSRDFGKNPISSHSYKEMLALAIKENRHDDGKAGTVARLERQLAAFSEFMRYTEANKPSWGAESNRAALRFGGASGILNEAFVEVFHAKSKGFDFQAETLKKGEDPLSVGFERMGVLDFRAIESEAYALAEERFGGRG